MPIAVVSHNIPYPEPNGQFSISSTVQVCLESGTITYSGDPFWLIIARTAPLAMDATAADVRTAVLGAVVAAVNAEVLPDETRLLPTGVDITADDVLLTMSYSRG